MSAAPIARAKPPQLAPLLATAPRDRDGAVCIVRVVSRECYARNGNPHPTVVYRWEVWQGGRFIDRADKLRPLRHDYPDAEIVRPVMR